MRRLFGSLMLLAASASVAVATTYHLDANGTGKITVPKKPVGTYTVKALTSVSKPGVIGNKDYQGSATCEATFVPPVEERAGSFFIDGAFGKERRERPYSEKYDDPSALGLSPSM